MAFSASPGAKIGSPLTEYSSSEMEMSTSLPTAKIRCFTCKKRVGITGFNCRCGHTFCNAHRYSDKHECDFDYKALGRETLSKDNPVVSASKIDKL